MPIAEAWRHGPGGVGGLPSDSAVPPDLVKSAPPAACLSAPPAPAPTAPPAHEQSVRLAPPPTAAPRVPAAPGRRAEPDGAAPVAWPEPPEEGLAPLPEPTSLPVERIEFVPDLTVLAAEALDWLAAHDPAALTDWLVGGSWAEASGRLAAVVAAWTRHGPAGDGSLGVELRHVRMLDVVGHDQVGFVSRTTVHRAPGGRPVGTGRRRAPEPRADDRRRASD